MAEVVWDPNFAGLSDRALDVVQQHLSEVRAAHKITCEIHRPRRTGTIGEMIANPPGKPIVKLRGKRSACLAAARDLDARRNLMVSEVLAES
jgi:hypothetical protein